MTITSDTPDTQEETRNDFIQHLTQNDQIKSVETPRERYDEHDKMMQPKKPEGERYGSYFVSAEGLFYSPLPKTPDETPQAPLLLGSPIWPKAHLRDSGGKSHTILIEVSDGERKHSLALPRRIIAKWGDLNDILLDLNQKTPVQPHQQKHLQTFLQEACPEKKMRCVDKAGWHGVQYVFPDGQVVGEAKMGEENIYPMNEACPKGVGHKGALKEWQDNVVSLCANNTRFIFSMGTAFAALCLNVINAEGGGFNLTGRSSKGKTKCLRVAVSVIGSREYERSWKTTGNGLEGICALHNDSLLPLDEFGQVDAREVGELCYMIAGGTGKQRSGRDGSPREPKTWSVIVLSTGEVGLEDHMRTGKKKVRAGQMARVVDIPAEVEGGYGCYDDIHGYNDGKDFADAIDKACRENYGTAAREFVGQIIKTGLDTIRQNLRHGIDDFVAEHTKNCDGQVKRVAERFGMVYSALLVAKQLGILGESITPDMIKASVYACYKAWLDGRGTDGDAETKGLIEQVVGLLQENAEGKFAGKTETLNEKVRNTLWGYRDGAVFYLFSHAFKEHLCAGYDSRQAAKMLIEEGLLIPGNDDKSSQLARIPAHHKQPDRFYIINLNAKKEEVECV